MTMITLREQLRHQIDVLPDDVLVEIADFAAFVLTPRRGAVSYVEWADHDWKQFALGQFLRESDDVEYTLADAEEVYRR